MTGKKKVIEDRLFSRSIIVAAIITTLFFASLMTYDYFESTSMTSKDMHTKQPQEHIEETDTNTTAGTNLADTKEEVNNG
ncbi:MAG: hypothetical protein V1645_01240 [archaeon]